METFACSLCYNGILGGALYLDDHSLTYKTNKLTVEKRFRNLVLPIQDIENITWKWIIFPITTVHLKEHQSYTFIIFNKSRFVKCFEEYSN